MSTDGFPEADLPAVTTDQMREIDRIMMEDLGIELIQMMENAGRNLADLAIARYRPASCTVLAGPGGNGGGGLVAARHLHNRGVAVTVALSEPALSGVPAHQLGILERMHVPIGDPAPADLIVDAVIGYSLDGDPRGDAATLIRWADGGEAPVLALDVPSGLDATTGRVGAPCVVADATLTLALPKVGLHRARHVVGELFVADISVPPAVYRELGLAVPTSPFADGTVVRLPGRSAPG